MTNLCRYEHYGRPYGTPRALWEALYGQEHTSLKSAAVRDSYGPRAIGAAILARSYGSYQQALAAGCTGGEHPAHVNSRVLKLSDSPRGLLDPLDVDFLPGSDHPSFPSDCT